MELFNKLSLNRFYKIYLYVFGIIFILSIFVDLKISSTTINQLFIFKTSLKFVLISIGCWIIEEFYHLISENTKNMDLIRFMDVVYIILIYGGMIFFTIVWLIIPFLVN